MDREQIVENSVHKYRIDPLNSATETDRQINREIDVKFFSSVL